jgi:hypothetical protein
LGTAFAGISLALVDEQINSIELSSQSMLVFKFTKLIPTHARLSSVAPSDPIHINA